MSQPPTEDAPPLATVHAHWANEAHTQAWAQRLAACPAVCNATVALHGDLGAGKTTFVRHLLRALGASGRIQSPTYALLEPHHLPSHHGPLDVWHFDFYRFSDPREWEDAGLRDTFACPGLKLVEWPDKARGLMGAADLAIHIQPLDESQRLVRLHAHSLAGVRWLGQLAATPEPAALEPPTAC